MGNAKLLIKLLHHADGASRLRIRKSNCGNIYFQEQSEFIGIMLAMQLCLLDVGKRIVNFCPVVYLFCFHVNITDIVFTSKMFH